MSQTATGVGSPEILPGYRVGSPPGSRVASPQIPPGSTQEIEGTKYLLMIFN